MRARLKKTLTVSAVIIFVGCAYAVFCMTTGLGLPCPFHLLTGLRCPGCGVSRMLLCLLHLDPAGAFRYNAVLLCLLPVLAVLFGLWIVRYVKTGVRSTRGAAAAAEWCIVGLLLIWGVVRNIIGA